MHVFNNNINKVDEFNNTFFFHFENYNFHVLKSFFISKGMLAFNWEILVNLTRNIVMLNRLN